MKMSDKCLSDKCLTAINAILLSILISQCMSCSIKHIIISPFSVGFCLFPVTRLLFLFPVLYSLFLVYRSLFSHFLFPKFEVNKALQTDMQTLPSSSGCRTLMLKSCCFIQFPRSTIASLCARKKNLLHIFSSTFIYISLFLIHIYLFPIFLLKIKIGRAHV